MDSTKEDDAFLIERRILVSFGKHYLSIQLQDAAFGAAHPGTADTEGFGHYCISLHE